MDKLEFAKKVGVNITEHSLVCKSKYKTAQVISLSPLKVAGYCGGLFYLKISENQVNLDISSCKYEEYMVDFFINILKEVAYQPLLGDFIIKPKK